MSIDISSIKRIDTHTFRVYIGVVSIGGQLRKIRKSKGYTLKQVGKILGVPHQSVQKYEKDKTEMRPSQIMTLCELFDVAPSYFFDEPSSPDNLRLHHGGPHAPELKMAQEVLDSNTHYADSLKMNIHSFHKAVEKERALEMRVAHVEKKLEDLSPPGGALPFVKHSDSSMKRKRKLPE